MTHVFRSPVFRWLPVRPARRLLLLASALLFAACATPINQARDLAAAGQNEQALAVLQQAEAKHPHDLTLRALTVRQRELTTTQLVMQAESERASGRYDAALQAVERLEAISPKSARAQALREDVARTQRMQKLLIEGRQAYERGQYDRAEAALRSVLAEDTNNALARSLLARIADTRAEAGRSRTLLAAGDKPVTLEFRDAPLRAVFEALSRAAGVNFVFDKEVRADQRVTLFLRDTTADEAMRIILATQQLDRKLLNENSVLVYPNNQQKQREHQELVTRSFYLVNADVKQAQTLVRTMAKTRDIFVDDRLNLLVVRDSPEVVKIVERLIDALDLAEPEVMMDVQVMEISSNVMRELGLSLPTQVSYGLPVSGAALLTTDSDLRSYIANPAALAKFGSSSGDSRLLANPRIRARNHEKARIQIGNKLPVFTSTTTATAGTTSTSVNYLDVGLKLEVEPSVLLDDDVIIKVGLEVSSVVSEVTANDGKDKAYNVGTRQATTSLRLRDGQTQVLAGLINDEDRRTAGGVVGLSDIPFLGALFGLDKKSRDKTEVVLLITPHIVRNLALPPAVGNDVFAGTDVQPGADSLSLRSKAKIAAPAGRGSGSGATPSPEAPDTSDADAAPGSSGELVLGGPQDVLIGSTFQVSVVNPGTESYSGELNFDASLFLSLDGGPNVSVLPVQLGPRGSRSFSFTVKPQSAVGSATFTISGQAAAHQVNLRKPGAAAVPGAGELAPADVR